MKYLGIVGISGSGKTTLMHRLIDNYPSTFFKMEQCTTREIRDNETGDAYVWLNSKRDYFKLEHLLIAKTEVRGELYGTIPEERDGMIGILVLNTKGVNDLLNNPPLNREEYFIIGLDKPEAEVVRDGRDQDYINKEREVLAYADHIITLKKEEYADVETVMKEVVNFFSQYNEEE